MTWVLRTGRGYKGTEAAHAERVGGYYMWYLHTGVAQDMGNLRFWGRSRLARLGLLM